MSQPNKSFRPPLRYTNRITASLLSQITVHRKMLCIVRETLPKSLAPHLSHCLIKQNKLLIYTDTAAWASQLRFHSHAIQESVNRQLGKTVTTVQVRILLPQTNTLIAHKRPQLPSDESIERLGNNIEPGSDEPLVLALKRLYKTLKTRAGKSAIENNRK